MIGTSFLYKNDVFERKKLGMPNFLLGMIRYQ
jgi:hypothetical protein